MKNVIANSGRKLFNMNRYNLFTILDITGYAAVFPFRKPRLEFESVKLLNFSQKNPIFTLLLLGILCNFAVEVKTEACLTHLSHWPSMEKKKLLNQIL